MLVKNSLNNMPFNARTNKHIIIAQKLKIKTVTT